jgi:uncharacterized protein YjiS (DUF1127 family)
MTAIDTTRGAGRIAPPGGRIAGAITALAAAVAAWNDARQTRDALARLSDRELEDIGLCRADIDDLIRARR